MTAVTTSSDAGGSSSNRDSLSAPPPVASVHGMDVLRLPGCAFAKSQHCVFFYDVTFCKVLASGVLYGLKLLRLKFMFWELYIYIFSHYIFIYTRLKSIQTTSVKDCKMQKQDFPATSFRFPSPEVSTVDRVFLVLRMVSSTT